MLLAGHLAGRIWSPDPETAPGHLVKVSHVLRQYVKVSAPERAVVGEQLRQELGWFNQQGTEFVPG